MFQISFICWMILSDFLFYSCCVDDLEIMQPIKSYRVCCIGSMSELNSFSFCLLLFPNASLLEMIWLLSVSLLLHTHLPLCSLKFLILIDFFIDLLCPQLAKFLCYFELSDYLNRLNTFLLLQMRNTQGARSIYKMI